MAERRLYAEFNAVKGANIHAGEHRVSSRGSIERMGRHMFIWFYIEEIVTPSVAGAQMHLGNALVLISLRGQGKATRLRASRNPECLSNSPNLCAGGAAVGNKQPAHRHIKEDLGEKKL